MSSSSDHETPKKAVKGRPTKEHFAAFVDATFKVSTVMYKRRVLTDNLFEIFKQAGVEKCRLART